MGEIRIIQAIKEGFAALNGTPTVFVPALGYAIASVILNRILSQNIVTISLNDPIGSMLSPSLIIPWLAVIIISIFASGMIINLLATSKKNTTNTLGDSAKFIAGKVPAMLMAMVLLSAGFAALFFLVSKLTILLMLPLFYVMIRLEFFLYTIIIDDEQGAIDSLKKSWALTEGQFWKQIGLVLFQTIAFSPLLLIIPVIQYIITLPTLGVLLLTIPISSVILAWMLSSITMAYLQLKE